ncbi:MAG: hypothetical protein KAG66_19920, partial [Methylococcales bacterium]|nr:hypothetical protein [Methylococcales bacterium]
SIGNVIWNDNGTGGGTANDGIINGGEAGIASVEVELYASGDTPGTDTPIATTTTAADGSYVFDSVVPGSYFVHVPVSEFGAGEPLESLVSTTGQGTTDGDDDNVDENGDDDESDGVSSPDYDVQANNEPTGEVGFVGTSLSTQDDDNTNMTVDFGFYEPVSIGNVIWNDNGTGGGTANDGIINGGEAGIAGVEVELYASGDTPGTDMPIATTTTAADGSYVFDGVGPANYFVHIPVSEFGAGEPLENLVSTTGQGTTDGDDDNVDENGDDDESDGVSSPDYDVQPNSEPTGEAGFVGTSLSTLDDDNSNMTVDFGFYEPVSIGNVIWNDNGTGGGTANDGIINGGEAGIADVVVELYASGDTPGTDTPIATTTTAADGSYILSAPPGVYFVHIPAAEFAASEPLEDFISSTGQGTTDADDDNADENGDDDESDGVSSPDYDLQPGLEPTAEAGLAGTTVSPSADNSTNSSVDFGFYEPVSIGNVIWN